MLIWLLACTPTPDHPGPDALPGPTRLSTGGERADVVAYGTGALISWVEDEGERRVAYLAHLGSDGAIGAPVTLPAEDPVAGLARKPQLASDGHRVLAVWSTGGPRGSTVVLAEADAPEGPYTTRLLATGDPSAAVTLVDQPDVHLAPDGEAWVGFKAEVDHPFVELRFARERTGWVPTPFLPAEGTPCECCPHSLRWLPSGDAWLVLRGNDHNLREIHEAQLQVTAPPVPGGDLTVVRGTQVSHTGWFVQGCPFDGPDAEAIDEERRVVAWVDPTAGPSRAWIAASVDGGAHWSRARPVLADDARIDQHPAFTALSDGTLVLAVDDYWSGTALLAGPPEAWLPDTDAPLIEHPDVERLPLSRPLWDVSLAPFAGGVIAVGNDEDGALWAEPLRISE